MIDLISKYKINPYVSEKELHAMGFHGNTYKSWLYNKSIQLIVSVDLDANQWNLQVFNTDAGELYSSYYNREYGVNYIVDILDKKIENILNTFTKGGLFRT